MTDVPILNALVVGVTALAWLVSAIVLVIAWRKHDRDRSNVAFIMLVGASLVLISFALDKPHDIAAVFIRVAGSGLYTISGFISIQTSITALQKPKRPPAA